MRMLHLSFHAVISAGLLCGALAVNIDSNRLSAVEAGGAGQAAVHLAAGRIQDGPLSTAADEVEKVKESLSLMLKKVKDLSEDARAAAMAPVILALGLTVIFMYFVLDPTRRSNQQQQQQQEQQGEQQEVAQADAACEGNSADDGKFPLTVIIALTSYRFYTGFLGATWVPFLIAKEGEALVQDRQSLFMGVEKLIYGFTIFLNPVFGLFSDKLAAAHPWCGRSSFLIAGVLAAAAGIVGAKLASDAHDAMWFLAASAAWMLGEALADTATEAVVPELLPRSQFDVAGAIKSLQFICGGLTGYISLIAFHDLHHHWLYIAYMSLMLVCALATVVILRNKAPVSQSFESRHQSSGSPFLASLVEAYIAPMQYAGGFPLACICMFTFSLGTAPIFFTLLMVRDLVGIDDSQLQQMHFSVISIVFLICAALSSVAAGTGDGESEDSQRPGEEVDPDDDMDAMERSPTSAPDSPTRTRTEAAVARLEEGREALGDRWIFMIGSTLAFGCMCAVLPTVGLFKFESRRLAALYIVSGLLGLSFGGVYARFQTCTWTLLPPGVNVANAMGFAAVMKVTGCGLGNFMAGLILDSFRVGGSDEHVRSVGYLMMSWCCALSVLLSVCLLTTIRRRQKRVLSFGPRCFCLC